MGKLHVRVTPPILLPRSVSFVLPGMMLLLAQLTLSLSLPAKPAVAGKQFHRATDLFSAEPSASAVDVVNVLGRWSTYAEVTLPPPPAQPREQQRNLVADTPGAGVR